MTPKRLWRGLPVLAGLVTISLGAPSVCADPARTDPAAVTQAVQAGLRILQKGTLGYSEKQNCFTCHNQTLPMLAQATARKHGFKINEELLHEQARFTHESFEERTSSLRRGKGIGGQSMTVAFGLWALDLAEWQPSETTEAMADFLIKTQEDNGRFFTNKSRPPLEDSPATSATLATYYLKKFASDNDQPEAEASVEKGRRWLFDYQPERQEDENSLLWGMHLLGAGDEMTSKARQRVLQSQRADGGWGQLPDMPSDPYATGQALWTLQETGLPTTDPCYQRGVTYLLNTQREDGSWLVKTRSKPIQRHFESGFPHGKDQFISICGTSWAVAALASTLPVSSDPPK